MKLRGQEVKLSNSATVEIQRGDTVFELNIQALRLGAETRCMELFPDPRPPMDYVYGGNGQVLRDRKTKRPLTEPNLADPDFVTKSHAVNRRQMCWFLWHGIQDDIEWSFVKEFGEYSDSWPAEQRNAFFDAMHSELADAGFTVGDMKRLMEAITEASNVDDVEEAKEDFS